MGSITFAPVVKQRFHSILKGDLLCEEVRKTYRAKGHLFQNFAFCEPLFFFLLKK